MARLYPVNERGFILQGFCPTKCADEDAEGIAYELAEDLKKYGFKYDHIVIEED